MDFCFGFDFNINIQISVCTVVFADSAFVF